MSLNMRHDGENEEKAMRCTTENLEPEEGIESTKCIRNLVSDQILILNTQRSRNCATSCQIFLQNVHGLHSSIPKHIASFDEKYALRCLELISNYAKRSAASSFSLKGDILPPDLNSLTVSRSRSSYEMISLAVDCPVAFGTEVVLNPSDEWTVAAKPVLQQFALLDGDAKFDRTRLPNASESVASPNGLIIESSHTLRKEAMVLGYSFASVPVHKRVASATSSNSSSSDKSSLCSTPSAMYQGMLQCKWKDGLLQYVFTVDDMREIHIANLSKVESSANKVLDYVYSFYSRKNIKKECPRELDLESVGDMQVSSSVTVCSDNSEVVETRFILSLSSDSRREEMQTSNHTLKKKKRLSKKVRSVFRSSKSCKHRSYSKFGASGAILEDASLDTSGDTNNGLDACEDIIEDKCTQDFESAAIIVKDRVFNNNKVLDKGGWGMKFLKKSGNDSSSKDYPERSTTVDVIIPAGFHGGSRRRTGGPSSLIDRWTSGGCCDCGGWDIGCPLTILNTKSSRPNSTPADDDSQECNTTDLFIQGSKQNTTPIMKMVNIHNGLYYIHFQSTLSILQSFAIATAIVHSGSPVLRSRLYRS